MYVPSDPNRIRSSREIGPNVYRNRWLSATTTDEASAHSYPTTKPFALVRVVVPLMLEGAAVAGVHAGRAQHERAVRLAVGAVDAGLGDRVAVSVEGQRDRRGRACRVRR